MAQLTGGALKRRSRGFLLVDVILAASLFGIVFASALHAVSMAIKASRRVVELQTAAVSFAETMTSIRSGIITSTRDDGKSRVEISGSPGLYRPRRVTVQTDELGGIGTLSLSWTRREIPNASNYEI